MRKIPRVPEEVRGNLGLPLAPLTRNQKILLIVFNIIVLIAAYVLWVNCKPQEQPKIQEVYTCYQRDPITLKTFYEDQQCKIYGDSLNLALSLDEMWRLWREKPRKTPFSLMLAKASIESNFRPYIYRYEKHLAYLKTDSLTITDIGMFQVLGMGIPHMKDLYTFHVEEQMNVFDSMMSACLLRANNDVKRAVFYYNTPFNIYHYNHNSELTYKKQQEFKQIIMKAGEKRLIKKIADYLGYSSVSVNDALKGLTKPLLIVEVRKCLERYIETGKVYVKSPDEIIKLKQVRELNKELEGLGELVQAAKTKYLEIEK